MAERVVDAALPLLGRSAAPGRTASEPLPGGGAPPASAELAAVPAEVREHLAATHGSDVAEVLGEARDPSELAPLVPGIPVCTAEIRHALRREMARTLADVLERRSRLALFATARACAIASRVAAIVSDELGWTAERREAEVAAFARTCDARLAWRGDALTRDAVAAAGSAR
jgi:glycerol-3-phosphate dehydrogenase